jgi:hypothetical protein
VILRFSRDPFDKSVPSLMCSLPARSVAKNNHSRSPQFEQRFQSSPDQHVNRVAFVTMAPYAPIKELVRSFHNNIAKAAGMNIQRQNSCRLSVVSFLDLIFHRCAASVSPGFQRSIAA